MKNNKISLRRLVNFGLLLFMVFFVVIHGQSILVPLTFGALIAFMLKPLCKRYERRIKSRQLAIALSMLTVLVPLAGLGYLLSKQCYKVVNDMPSIKEKLNAGLSRIYGWAKNTLGYSEAETDQFFSEKLPSMLSDSRFFDSGFNASTAFIAGFFLTFIYIYLFLLYRSAFKGFILVQLDQRNREGIEDVLSNIQKVIQGYLRGLVAVIAILATLLSLGLFIIGIEHPIFWGFLAAMLAIIPYVGTFIGGLLPFLYAVATSNEPWQPIAVIIMFVIVQALEGNFITPKVVGSSVSVNPLVAIIALLIGAEVWGIAGMILSLPMTAIFNELLKQSDAWRPVSLLISDDLHEKHHYFWEKWDKERFRLSNFFKLPQ